MLQNNLCKLFEFCLSVHATGWITWRTEDEHPCFWSDCSFELCCCHLEILVEASIHDDGDTACQFHHLRIAHPVGCRDDYLVARVYKCHDGIADTLLATCAHDDFVGSVV